MLLYKYRPINKSTLESLSEGTVYFNCPNNYNDPFDSQIEVIAEGTDDEIKQYYKEKNYSKHHIRSFERVFNSENSREKINKRNLVETIRIFCFSKTKNNILLWSHYADSHKGICIAFETKNVNSYESLAFHKEDFNNNSHLIDSNISFIYPVTYSKTTPPPLNIIKQKDDKLIEQWMTTKSNYWKYEKEYRIVITQNQLRNDKPRYIENQLKEIIFGINCSESDISLVKKVLHNKKVRFSKAYPSNKKYKVEILPLP